MCGQKFSDYFSGFQRFSISEPSFLNGIRYRATNRNPAIFFSDFQRFSFSAFQLFSFFSLFLPAHLADDAREDRDQLVCFGE